MTVHQNISRFSHRAVEIVKKNGNALKFTRHNRDYNLYSLLNTTNYL